MNSKDTYKLFWQGKKLAVKNEHLKAAMFFEKACALEPQKGSIHEALAISYFNCGFFSEAKKHFKLALDIDPSNDFSYYGLGLCLAKEGKIEAGLGNIKIAFAMRPHNTSYGRTVTKYNMLLKQLEK